MGLTYGACGPCNSIQCPVLSLSLSHTHANTRSTSMPIWLLGVAFKTFTDLSGCNRMARNTFNLGPSSALLYKQLMTGPHAAPESQAEEQLWNLHKFDCDGPYEPDSIGAWTWLRNMDQEVPVVPVQCSGKIERFVGTDLENHADLNHPRQDRRGLSAWDLEWTSRSVRVQV